AGGRADDQQARAQVDRRAARLAQRGGSRRAGMALVDADHGLRAHVAGCAVVAPATAPGTLRSNRPGDPLVFRLFEPAVRSKGLAGTRHHPSGARIVVGAPPDRGAGTLRADAKSDMAAIASEASVGA